MTRNVPANKISSLLMVKLMVIMMLETFETVRTTITIPADMNKRSQHFVDAGLVPSRNALIVAALEKYLLELEREEIDRQFEAMADDKDYHRMNEQLSEAFSESDFEAFVEGETE